MYETKSLEIKDELIIGLWNYDQYNVSWAFIVFKWEGNNCYQFDKTENCNKFKCSWQRCWKNAFYRPNSETFNGYTLISFSCGLIHFREFCVGCYAYNESPKVLNPQIIIYTTRLPPMKRKPFKGHSGRLAKITFFAETFYSYVKWSNRSWSSSFELQYWKVVQSQKRDSSMLSVKSEKVTFQKKVSFQ